MKDVNLLDLLGRLKEKVSNDLLSEGQKQRIGIVRALLKGSNIIIMDEATANLDKANANFIENNLLKNTDITQIEDKVLRSYSSGDFSCIERV